MSASTILRRVFCDPVDDSVMLLDAGTYRFTSRQAEAIRALHPISTFPGDAAPATKCDLDHKLEYRTGPPGQPDPPGQTVVANGQPLRRRHHRAKTHAGWTVRSDPADLHLHIWTSPHGRVYTANDRDGA